LEQKDYIKDLFSEKLGNHEVQVNSELWTSIESKIPSHTILGNASNLSILSKSIITLSTALGILTISYFIFKEDSIEKSKLTEKGTTVEPKKNNSVNHSNDKKMDDLNQFKTKNKNKNNTKKQLEYFSFQDTLLSSNLIILSNNWKIENKENKNMSEKQTVFDPKISEKNTTIENKIDEKVNDVLIEKDSYFIGELLNVFTPNNDNLNDEFFIKIEGLKDFSLIILDKNNKRVYSTTDPNFKWNGKDFSDNLVPKGQYIYFFTGIDSKGNTISKSNSLTIQY
jgi:gliding motility-associated-like protein